MKFVSLPQIDPKHKEKLMKNLWQLGFAAQDLVIHILLIALMLVAIKLIELLIDKLWGPNLIWFQHSYIPLRVEWIFNLADVVFLFTFLTCAGYLFIKNFMSAES
jgi:hypothetical protein